MRHERGFSLIETLVAISILTAGLGALVQLALVAVQSDQRAAVAGLASILAGQKMEELRGLALAGDAGQLVVSPPDSLESNVTGYCDLFDGQGRPLPDGLASPAVYVRRWSIQPVAGLAHVLMVQVVVTHLDAQRVHLTGIVARRSAGG